MNIRSLNRDRGFLLPALCTLLLLLAAAAGAQAEKPQDEKPAAQTEKPQAQAEKPQTEEPQAQAEKPQTEEPQAEEPAAQAENAGEADPEGGEEEERTWLVDDQGMHYYVRKVAKATFGVYRRMDDGMVRGRFGGPLKLAGEDDEYFYQKIFKVEKTKIPTGPSEEDLARVAATYKAELKDGGDVLELVPFDEGLPRQGLWRHGFDVADMNGDGHLDIVHGPPRKAIGAPPQIFLGDSRGHWRPWQEATFPPAPYDYGDADVADLNGDGHSDIVLGMHIRGLLALVGDGEGGFEAWTEGIELERRGHDGRPAFTSRQVETVDWNGDSRPDILALSEGPRGITHADLPGANGTVIYLNQGDGTWSKLEEEEPRIIGHHLRVADLNGDSRPDFVTSSSTYAYHWLVNLHQEDDTWTPTSVDVLRPRGWVWAIEVADWNGDSRLDLVLSYSNQELGVERAGVDVLYAREDGGWDRRPLLVFEGLRQASRGVMSAFAAGQLDGDGALDLVALNEHGQLLIFRGDGEGFFVSEEEPFVDTREEPEDRGSCRGYTVMAVDLDRDGRDEIVASFAGETCRRGAGGSLRAWRVKDRPDGSAARGKNLSPDA